MSFLDNLKPYTHPETANDIPDVGAVSEAMQEASSTLNREVYTVVDGDTLDSIAQAHGVPAEEIAGMNHLVSAEAIFVGQTLVIPAES